MNQTSRISSVDPRNTEPQAVRILRACMGGPLFMVAAILLTLSLLFTSANLLNVDSMVSTVLYQLPSTEMRILFSSYKGLVLFTLGFSMLMQLLYVIGLWCAFGAARSRKSPVGTGGLTLIQSMVIVTIVLLGLAALIYAVLFVIACVALAIGSTAVTASISGDSSGAAVLGMSWAVVIFMIVLVVAVFALVFVYFGSVLNTIGRVKYTARTGKAGQPVSMFLIVMNFILFVFGLLGLPLTLMTTLFARTGAVSLYGVFGVLTQICSFTAMLLLTIQLLIYRRRMQPVRFAENPPRSGYHPSEKQHIPVSPVEMHVSVEQKQTFTAPIPDLPVDSTPAASEQPVQPLEASAPVEPVSQPVVAETPAVEETLAPAEQSPVLEEPVVPVQPAAPVMESQESEPEKPVDAAVILPPEQDVVAAVPAVSQDTEASQNVHQAADEPVAQTVSEPVQPVEEKPAAVVLPPQDVISVKPEPPVAEKPAEAKPAAPQAEPKRPAVKYCTNCGAKLPVQALFCNQCGHKQPPRD